MTLLVPNEGEVVALEAFVNKTAATDPILKLFKSNTTPAETDTAATYTEADFTGYSAITLTGSSWNAATSGAPSYIDYAQQTFTCSGAGSTDIYGYYIVGTTNGKLLWAERDASAPFTVTTSGDTVKVTPKITAD